MSEDEDGPDEDEELSSDEPDSIVIRSYDHDPDGGYREDTIMADGMTETEGFFVFSLGRRPKFIISKEAVFSVRFMSREDAVAEAEGMVGT